MGLISGVIKRFKSYGKLVMFSHTVFSLPFGLIAMLWACGGLPPARIFGYILAALVAARNGANAFNRIADRHIDAKNPRTAGRPLQQKTVKPAEAWAITVICFLIMAFCAWRLNTLCLILLPFALSIFVFYSYTKRFTWLCHFVLGVACGGAPVGAWAAASGSLEPTPFVLGAAVCFWVAGFDIYYALRDIEFDRREGLHSVPARFGREPALEIAALSHGASLCCLLLIPVLLQRDWPFFVGIAAIAVLLLAEHLGAREKLKLNRDFMAYGINQLVSVVFFAFAALDLFLSGGL